MKKHIIALLVSALCGLVFGLFIGSKILEPVRMTFYALTDVRITTMHVVSSLSTLFTGVIRFSIRV